ncbi:MAG TPA: ABC transporter substrate-binding protein, partial [Spirochaetales bacterium]|nr:ABC transporter substrate-binding protein [Spirochaetales bacterium]
MKKKFIAVLLTVLSVSLILAGCSQKTTEIKIGGVGPVSGEAATFGQSTKEGYELAVEEWNKAGGLLGNQIKLIFQDDKGDP